MATLGTWFIGVGVANALLGGMATRINDPWIRGLAIQRVLGFPWGVWLALACLAIAFVIQNYTRLGRYIYALGGGEELAALSGISVARVRIVTFTLAGVFYAIGGILAAAQLGLGQRPDRQRTLVHHGHRRRCRRNIAVGRAGRRLADLRRRADRVRAVERHGADGRAAERADRLSRPDDHRSGRAVD